MNQNLLHTTKCTESTSVSSRNAAPVSIASQGQVTFMKWDHAGRRVELWASSSGDTWHYIYDPTASIPAILAEVKNGSVEALYVREPGGGLLARVSGNDRQYYFFDGLGSTQAICPAVEGNPTDRYFYTPWGELDARNESLSGTSGNPYRYVGQLGYYHHHQDPNFADWLQLGIRFYNPELGRFERRDPVHLPMLSSYVYTNGHVFLVVDPTGLFGAVPGIGNMPGVDTPLFPPIPTLYGKYCGPQSIKGIGPPIDDLDACCKVHDEGWEKCGCNAFKQLYRRDCRIHNEILCACMERVVCLTKLCESNRKFFIGAYCHPLFTWYLSSNDNYQKLPVPTGPLPGIIEWQPGMPIDPQPPIYNR